MTYRFVLASYCRIRKIQLLSRGYSSKVPSAPVTTVEKKDSNSVRVDKNTLDLLERLSLVKCDTAEGVKVLEDTIAFADKILHINTDNVEPLYSVLEKQNLSLRSDEITQGNCQKDILSNASVTEDDYFIAPPGNIPLHELQTENNLPDRTQKVKQNEVSNS